MSAGTALGDGNGVPGSRYYAISRAERFPGEVRLWDLAKPGQSTAATYGEFGGLSLGMSPNGKWLAVGRSDGRTLVVDYATQRVVTVLAGHRYPVWAVAIADDGRVATGGGDWDIPELNLWTRPESPKPKLGIVTGQVLGKGFVISSLDPSGLAAKAGIREGDVLVELDGVDLKEKEVEIRELIGRMRPGEVYKIIVVRKEERLEKFIRIPPRVYAL